MSFFLTIFKITTNYEIKLILVAVISFFVVTCQLLISGRYLNYAHFTQLKKQLFNAKNIQLTLEFLKDPALVLHFCQSTLMTFLMMLYVILLSMLMINLSLMILDLIFGNNQSRPLNLNLTYKTPTTSVGSILLIQHRKTQLVLFDQFNSFGAIDVKMNRSVLEAKLSFSSILLLGLSFSWIGALILLLLLKLPLINLDP